MVSGHRRRTYESIRLSAVALGSALLGACSIGLSASSASFDGTASDGGGSYDVHSTGDAGTTATIDAAGVGASDAGAPTSATNPLCNVQVQNEGGTCDPDFAIAPSGELCQAPDAGLDSGLLADGGPALLACRVALSTAKTVIQTCTVTGTGQDGDSCNVADDCAPAFECVGTPGRCRHYCCEGDKSCGVAASALPSGSGNPGKSFCDIQANASNLLVPVCAPVSSCKLLTANACAEGQTCAVVKDDGTTSCVTIGAKAAGEDCNSEHCAAGLTCLGNAGARKCFKLCRVSYPEDCDKGAKCTGSAQLFNDPDYGICQ